MNDETYEGGYDNTNKKILINYQKYLQKEYSNDINNKIKHDWNNLDNFFNESKERKTEIYPKIKPKTIDEEKEELKQEILALQKKLAKKEEDYKDLENKEKENTETTKTPLHYKSKRIKFKA